MKTRLRVRGVQRNGNLTEKTAKKYGFAWDELYGWKSNIKGSADHIHAMETVLDLIGACTKTEFHSKILQPALEEEAAKINPLKEEQEAILRDCVNEEWALKIIKEEKQNPEFNEKELRRTIDQLGHKRKKIDPQKLKAFKF